MTKKEFSYGVIPVKVRDGGFDVLLVKQAQGFWSFPKGHMEEGESPIETALREGFEETGIRMNNLIEDKMFSIEYMPAVPRPGFVDKLVGLFVCFPEETLSSVPSEFASEIHESRWFDYKDLPNIFEREGWKNLAKEVIEFLHGYKK